MTRLLGIAAVVFTVTAIGAAQAPPQRFGFGTPAAPDAIARVDIDVRPDGAGLPEGSGTVIAGRDVYARQCAACHGANGEGGAAEALVGSDPPGIPPFGPEYERWRNGRPDVPFTIGNYWPYATTVFDYVRRAMPYTAPGTLTANDTYAVVAWLLARNGIIPESATMSRETLPRVEMPARARFVRDNRTGGREIK